MKYAISLPHVWKRKFAWYPRRIGPVRIWLERYEVRDVPGQEAQVRYPILYFPVVQACWLEEFRHGGKSYWRLTRFSLMAFGICDREWVSVKPMLKAVAS